MLEHLRQRAVEILASSQAATLSTSGPAGIQARIFPCEALGLTLYFLIPTVSDQLVNLESEPSVVVSTTRWQLNGSGRIVPVNEVPPALALLRSPETSGCALVEIRPLRLHINRHNGWGFSETIDLDP